MKTETALNAETVSAIERHYRNAKEKHPYFCDRITCLSDVGADTHLSIHRNTLASEVKVAEVEVGTLLYCEFYEAIQAYTRGDTAAAVKKCYDAIAVLLRMIDVLEGRHPLGKSKSGGRGMNLLQRILITALAFWIGILLMPLTPFLMAWLFWDETDKDGEDGQ